LARPHAPPSSPLPRLTHRPRSKEVRSAALTYDEELARAIWDRSVELTDLRQRLPFDVDLDARILPPARPAASSSRPSPSPTSLLAAPRVLLAASLALLIAALMLRMGFPGVLLGLR